jgi:hypothetical protein
MKNKILAIMVSEPSWQYYVKYRQYLNELKHPFRNRIDFFVDQGLTLDENIILQYPVVAFYYHDPLKALYPKIYAYAKKIECICLAHKIKMINRPEPLSNSVKSVQLKILADNGFLVAKAFSFNATKELAKIDKRFFPLFIRNDAGHDTDNESVQGPFSSYEEIKEKYNNELLIDRDYLKGKVAVQWIDTKSKDGLYRRYRVFVCGDGAITGNMHISSGWYIHSVNNNDTDNIRKEKEAFTNRKLMPAEVDFFVKASKALDLDFGAFDFAFTKEQQIVIWEDNPHPAFPAWTEKEPTRSNITNLISDQYEKILFENLRSFH